jgi:hypothetical protein
MTQSMAHQLVLVLTPLQHFSFFRVSESFFNRGSSLGPVFRRSQTLRREDGLRPMEIVWEGCFQ